MKTRLAVYALLLIVAVFYTVPPAHAGTPSQRLMLPQNTDQFTYAPLAQPQCAAVDGQGNVYIADSTNYRILKYSPSGALLAKLGSYGAGNGQFYQPAGVAVDGDGNVYVADSYLALSRIQKFDSNGAFVTKWGTFGDADGQFKSPWGVAVDSLGNVYVTDTTNRRVQKFASNGGFIPKWGSNGTADGQFYVPYGVAVDGQGNVYVADNANFRIQKFDSNGTFILKWGTFGSANSQFMYPWGVAVDSLGNVYVADQQNFRVQKFNSNGGFITKWGIYGTGNGQFQNPWAWPWMARTTSGSPICLVGPQAQRIIAVFRSSPPGVHISPNGGATPPATGSSIIPGAWPWTARETSTSGILITTAFRSLTSTGAFLTKWGSFGTGDTQFYSGPDGVAVDGEGNVYAMDWGTGWIKKFGPNGNFILKWGSGLLGYARGLAADSQGNVYVADTE